jgi:putative transposase
MEQVYEAIGITRQAIWKWKQRSEAKAEQTDRIIQEVKRWRQKHPKMGSRPMYYSMKCEGIALGVGVNQFEQIIKDHHLVIGKARSRKPKCSDGKGKEDYPNLTNGLELTGINQLIVLDITYIWITTRWCYIFSLKDVYSQLVVLTASENLEAKHAITCLDDFVKLRGPLSVRGCIHHTDNGSQYNCGKYKDKLAGYGILISRSTQCKENGSSEQSHHVSKNMYLEPLGLKTFAQLKKACKDFMYKNNYKRAIKQLGHTSVSNEQCKIERNKLFNHKKLFTFKLLIRKSCQLKSWNFTLLSIATPTTLIYLLECIQVYHLQNLWNK